MLDGPTETFARLVAHAKGWKDTTMCVPIVSYVMPAMRDVPLLARIEHEDPQSGRIARTLLAHLLCGANSRRVLEPLATAYASAARQDGRSPEAMVIELKTLYLCSRSAEEGAGTTTLADLRPNGIPLLSSIITWAVAAYFAPDERGDSWYASDHSDH
jgi:hypothetical protein